MPRKPDETSVITAESRTLIGSPTRSVEPFERCFYCYRGMTTAAGVGVGEYASGLVVQGLTFANKILSHWFLAFFANKWSTDWDALPHCSGGGGGGGMPRHSTAPGCELQKVPSGSEDLVAWLVQSNRILSKPYSHFFAPASSSIYIYIYNCAEHVCSIAYLKKHTSKLRCILSVAVTRSSSYQNAILYVLPVSWMTSFIGLAGQLH